jgi:hypothetical protein
MTPCAHWQDIGTPHGGKCALHDKTCSFGVCRACLDNTATGQFPTASTLLQRARIGTRIKAATTAIGIKPCGGCQKRAQRMNGD